MKAKKNLAIGIGVGVLLGALVNRAFDPGIVVQTAAAVVVGFITMGALTRRWA
ncbi:MULTISPECIES: hypothetical protein [Roseobacteraceae]|uniref:Uncharacterized protein n=1 Tax=Falsiruegeria litorea TaxID=1280831 RepID=A0ABS5WQ38_9RHOB|nr:MULTISPECIES: hypothetical protein [Roseobacteraceae]MBT3141158.1 hypothetical protein [Falsiruegeria litorea]MBT8170843.1 hypothetical protein [Falsiruegeria litorea]